MIGTEAVTAEQNVKQLRSNAIVVLSGAGTDLPAAAIAGSLQMAADLIESQARRIAELESDNRQLQYALEQSEAKWLALPPPESRTDDDLNTAIRLLEEIRDGAEDEWPALNEFLERVSEKQLPPSEYEPADADECCIFSNGSGSRCVAHGTTWGSGPCPATVPRGGIETTASL